MAASRRSVIRSLVVAAVLTTCLGEGAGAEPRGHLVIIGGGDRPASIMQVFARLAGGATGHVLVFPQASSLEDAGVKTKAELEALGVGRVDVIGVGRAEADSDEVLARTLGATGVYFTGGDQTKLMGILGGTRLARRLAELYVEGAVIAGTSAGAAVMSGVMITGDERRPLSKDEAWQTIEAGNVVTGEGLGLLTGVVIDQHFVRRKRHNRLISLVLERPDLLGVAIDEATALWVKPGGLGEVIGIGPVLVYDAGSASVARDADGVGVRGAGLRLHVLRAGSQYDLRAREVVRLGPEE